MGAVRPGAEWGNEGWEGKRGGTKGSREGPLGAVEGHSRGAPLHPLPPRPEGHRAGGMGELKRLTWRGDGRLKAPEEDAGEGVWGTKLRRMGVLDIHKSRPVPSITSIHFTSLFLCAHPPLHPLL